MTAVVAEGERSGMGFEVMPMVGVRMLFDVDASRLSPKDNEAGKVPLCVGFISSLYG